MSAVTIRNLSDATHRALKVRAAPPMSRSSTPEKPSVDDLLQAAQVGPGNPAEAALAQADTTVS